MNFAEIMICTSFLDGARLGAALCSAKNDLSLADLSTLTDIFTIGGTKNGALIGEAIVVNNPHLAQDFNIHIKQRGALLAKGRLLGIQFWELFKSSLYFELATYANSMAKNIADAFVSKGYKLVDEPQTNQIFPILPNTLINQLQEHFNFYVWESVDNNNSVVRLVTSWATDVEKVEEFIGHIPANESS